MKIKYGFCKAIQEATDVVGPTYCDQQVTVKQVSPADKTRLRGLLGMRESVFI